MSGDIPNISLRYSAISGIRFLAAGTSSVVHSGLLGARPVAIKEFIVPEEVSGDALERAEEEIRVVQELQHPLLCDYIMGGTVSLPGRNSVVLVTELFNAPTLADTIRSYQRLGGAERSKLCGHVLPGVLAVIEYLETKGVVHRDIKLENILYNAALTPSIKVIDFGLAKRFTRSEPLPSSWETNAASRFRSPQKWLSFRSSDALDDVWAVGVVGYCILHGAFPFSSRRSSGSEDELRGAILYELPRPGASLRTRQGRALENLIAGLLRKNKRARLRPSAAVRALERIAALKMLPDDVNKPQITWPKRRTGRLRSEAARHCRIASPDEARVALVAEKVLCIENWGLRDSASLTFLKDASSWLARQQLKSGAFPSKTLQRATTYCTAVACVALQLVSENERLDEQTRQVARAAKFSATEALYESRTGEGWTWFMTPGRSNSHASMWASLAISLAEKRFYASVSVVEGIDRAVYGSPEDPLLPYEASIYTYFAGTMSRHSLSTSILEKSNLTLCRKLFPAILSGKIEGVDDIFIEIPDESRKWIGGTSRLHWWHPTSCYLARGVSVASIMDKYLLDANIEINSQLIRQRQRIGMPFFMDTWIHMARAYLVQSLSGHPS